MYNALFYAAWKTIQTLSADSKHLGAKTGMTAVLHTWGQQLWLHPHLHCIIPAGGITPDGNWKSTKGKGKYLFPQLVMSRIYRASFMKHLRGSGVIIPQNIAKKVFSKDWVVYAKQPFSSPKTVVEYLGRYTHKVAISNHRLKSVDNHQIQFTYKDYRQGAKKLTCRISPNEFLRRYVQHILPKGFVRMRHYGILASKNKSKELNIAKAYFDCELWEKQKFTWQEIAQLQLDLNPDQCSKCKNLTIEILGTMLPERGPPILATKPNQNFTHQKTSKTAI